MLLTVIIYKCETNKRLKMEVQKCLLFSKSLRDRNSASGSPYKISGGWVLFLRDPTLAVDVHTQISSNIPVEPS